MKQCVYFIRAVGTNMVKIGYTASGIKQRLSGLNTSSPFDLECVFLLPSDDPTTVELEIHNQLAQYRRRGEWFELSDGDLSGFLAINYPGHISQKAQIRRITNATSIKRFVKDSAQQSLYLPDSNEMNTEFPGFATWRDISTMDHHQFLDYTFRLQKYFLEQKFIAKRGRHERRIERLTNFYRWLHSWKRKGIEVYQIIRA